MSAFSIDCECGTQLPVSASQAGATIECRCGRAIKVPLLSELRQRHGQAAYETGPIDTIQRLIAAGELPSSDVCVISGRPTKSVCGFHVQCETTWVKTQGVSRYALVLIYLLYPVTGLMHFLNSRNDPDPDAEVHGRNRGVDVMLRVDEEFQPRVRRLSQNELKKLLRTEAAYAALLDEFPTARIF